ncbi:cytochrome P450 [Lentinus tigrinus ALCF2SS1-7]|uniref:cytochrome P450 n=1 Tax=Lentinus tigrinus ALCF2SS1-7 TaxID=1328758 RepID=UPI0011662A65|nr:cytochrome P450 [Lentinus tigrinus ALCF2SS1-7]
MRNLPPGPTFLLHHLPAIATPPVVTVLAAYAVGRLSGVHLPVWVVVAACFASFPVFIFGRSAWADLRARRAAAALGAEVAVRANRKDVKPSGEDKFPRDFLFRLCEINGNTFVLQLYSLKRFFTIEPEHVKAILATDFASFQKGPGFRSQMKSLLGVGVFNADDEMWKFHRSMTRPFFSKDRISHFEMLDRHANDALRQMKIRLREGYAVDWQDLVSRFTLDSATEFLFGKDVRSLSAGLPYPPTSDIARTQTTKPASDEFASAFYNAQLASSKRGRFQDWWPLVEFWHDKVEAQKSTIDKFIAPILTDALQKKTNKGPEDEKVTDEDTLLSQLLKVTDDYNIIRDETLNILLAGRDTTACTLTFAVYRLAEHKDVLNRLREEVLNVVGPIRRPTYDDIRNMKFLRAVINETLRLYPPVPMNIRHAIKDTVLPPTTPGGKGIFVPAGMKMIYSVFMMHRRKDLWGPDALTWDPDRFIDERVQKYLTPNPFIFLPFNAGPRICLGQQFAYNEASFMLVRLVQQFSAIEFTPEVAPESVTPPGYADSPGSDGTDRVWMGNHLTMYAKGGLWVKMTEATD